jgi:hypothetical protein
VVVPWWTIAKVSMPPTLGNSTVGWFLHLDVQVWLAGVGAIPDRPDLLSSAGRSPQTQGAYRMLVSRSQAHQRPGLDHDDEFAWPGA